MMKIVPISAFQDNYIWCLIDESSNRCAVVDPGDAKPVMVFLKKHGLQLNHILITHHHFDHTGGIAELVVNFTVNVYGPGKEDIPHITHRLHENDHVDINQHRLSVLSIPGHTIDHIAYYVESAVFCGDTLFTAGCGKIFEGSPPQMYHSLMKLADLPDDTLIYCGHEYTLNNLLFAQTVEPQNRDIQQRLQETKALRTENKPSVPSSLSLERKTNPFLRCHEPSVVQAVSQHYQTQFNDAVDVFTHLRDWKNHFS